MQQPELSVSKPVAIIGIVNVVDLHDWHLAPTKAAKLQRQLAAWVSGKGVVVRPHFIAGIDVAVGQVGKMATGAVVVLSYPELKLEEARVVQGKLDFPYIPGFLSFREAPLALATCRQISGNPDLVMVDGHGIAHPRRMGLASHIGLFLDMPTIGCAKSLLCGKHEALGRYQGNSAEVVDKDETIGAALRTKLKTNPVYISTGHKVELRDAIHWVLACCRGYRLPEPIRLAHMVASNNLETERIIRIPDVF